ISIKGYYRPPYHRLSYQRLPWTVDYLTVDHLLESKFTTDHSIYGRIHMKQLNISKLATFLVLCFGMSWGAFALLQAQLSSSAWIQGILAILFIWGPGIAAILTHTFIWGEPLTTLGYYKKPLSWRDWSRSYLGPVGIVLFLLGVIFILGNVFHIPSAGRIVLPGNGAEEIQAYNMHFCGTGFNIFDYFFTKVYIINEILPGNSLYVGIKEGKEIVANSTALNLIVLLILAWVLGTFLFSFILRGEELGFRGFLLHELKSKGFLGSNLIIGTVWGLYASGPTLLMSSPGFSMGSLIFPTAFCISLSFPLAYLRINSGTIRSSSVFRGLLTVFTLLLFVLTWDTDIGIWGPTGLLGMGIFLIITWFIIRRDPEFIKEYEPGE
ncbi:MAG: CPBP family glutamic-type intramembrane protease, partial [Bacteroidota bacterium]